MMMISKVQFRWNDFDALGHLYNGSYNSIYDIAQQELITTVLGLEIPTMGNIESHRVSLFPIKASISINYFREITPEMEVEVFTRVGAIGNKSLTVVQELRLAESGFVLSDCRSVMVCVDMTDKSTQIVPESWREAIRERFGLL